MDEDVDSDPEEPDEEDDEDEMDQDATPRARSPNPPHTDDTDPSFELNFALYTSFLRQRHLSGHPIRRLDILVREGDVSEACIARWRDDVRQVREWVEEAEVKVVEDLPSPDGGGDYAGLGE